MVSQKKKKEVVYRPIPIPKTEEELEEMVKDEEFFQKTKDFRAQLRVKEMIKVRKDTMIQAKIGKGHNDPLYPIEYNEASQPFNVEKLSKIPF